MCNRWINSCLIQTKKQNPHWFLDAHQKRTATTMRLDDLLVETTMDAQSPSLQLSLSYSKETLTGSCWQHSSLLQWFQRSSMGKAYYRFAERPGLCRDLQRYSVCWCHPAGTREGINQRLDMLKACRGLAICKWVWKRLRQPWWAEQRGRKKSCQNFCPCCSLREHDCWWWGRWRICVCVESLGFSSWTLSKEAVLVCAWGAEAALLVSVRLSHYYLHLYCLQIRLP